MKYRKDALIQKKSYHILNIYLDEKDR